MEEFFYLILIIIWLIISVFQARRKKAQQSGQQPARPASEPPPAKQKDLEDILEEFFGETKPKVPEQQQQAEVIGEHPPAESLEEYQEEPYQPSYSFEEMKPTALEQEYAEYTGMQSSMQDYEFSSEGKVDTIEDLIRMHAAEDARLQAIEEETYEREAEFQPEDFDLRKAVIASEILNRKYT